MSKSEIRVLVIDDDKLTRNLLYEELNRSGYKVSVVEDGTEGIKVVEENTPDVVLLDIKLPDIDGIELLEKIKEYKSLIEVIMITAYGNIELAVSAMKKGAYDFVTKPFSLSEIEVLIKKAYERKELQMKALSLKYMTSKIEHPVEIITKNKKMQEVLDLSKKVSLTDYPVIIEGETGTGKEVLANYIHFHSARKDAPFVVVNCAELQENLLESEMFGYEKGAFTGASSKKIGLVEIAEGGTLFLDEIASMEYSVQSKLLRLIETGEFRRLGAVRPLKANVRIIVATNKNLQEEVGKGRFREDLYYRLNVVTIKIPPLRERKEDIPYLVEYFLKKISPVKYTISPSALKLLVEYYWKGNIRELKNFLEKIVIMSSTSHITEESVISHLVPYQFDKDEVFLPLEEFELNYIKKVLEYTGGNKTKASEILKIDRKTLRAKLKEVENNSP